MGLFTPAWKSKNLVKARRAVERITDKKKLVRVAKKADYNEICARAIRKLNDEDLVMDVFNHILNGDRSYEFKGFLYEAVANTLTNKTNLRILADHNHVCYEARMIAYEKLDDQQGIESMAAAMLKIVYNAKYWEFDHRKKLLNLLKDEVIIADLIINALDYEVAKSAWELFLIKSPKLLVEIAESKMNVPHGSYDIRLAAILSLNDEEELSNLAMHRIIPDKAFDKINDIKKINHIALNSKDKYMREKAIEKVTDEEVLKKVARNDSSYVNREKAIEKVTDEEVLKKVALNDSSYFNRAIAMEKITDDDVLKEIARNDNHYNNREMAKEKLAINHRNAVSKITDEEQLKHIALHDSDESARIIAIQKISDNETLANIALTVTDNYVRGKAISRLKNQEVLYRIAKNDTSWLNRLAAYKGLNECNDEILCFLENIYIGQYKSRIKAAKKLIELLKNNPLAAKLFWDSVSDMSIEKHEDHTNHDDWRSSSSDCNHTDSNKHTDTGIGVVFPPYPFND